jgi:hypothetical protein
MNETEDGHSPESLREWDHMHDLPYINEIASIHEKLDNQYNDVVF